MNYWTLKFFIALVCLLVIPTSKANQSDTQSRRISQLEVDFEPPSMGGPDDPMVRIQGSDPLGEIVPFDYECDGYCHEIFVVDVTITANDGDVEEFLHWSSGVTANPYKECPCDGSTNPVCSFSVETSSQSVQDLGAACTANYYDPSYP